jgi:small subunit ribosomal protein S20
MWSRRQTNSDTFKESKDDGMANTKSAKKAARQTTRRTEINKSRSTRARTAVRSVEEAIAAGDKDAAIAALKAAAPVLVRSAQKGVVHKNTASRKVSRLNARVKAMSS